MNKANLTTSEITNNIIKVLKDEMQDKELSITKDFIDKELKSEKFIIEHKYAQTKLEQSENEELYNIIIIYILLGMGRNRTINILKEYDVNRTVYEKARDMANLKESEIRINNEKQITKIKIETTKRNRRLNKIVSKVDWEKFKERYINGESAEALSEEHKVSSHLVKEQLKDENLFDETRSSLVKKKIADYNKESIDDNFIKNLVEDNPLESKETWWKMSKNKYPWILRRQFYDKLDELNLMRTDDEVNAIRRLKSKTMSNTDYAVKVNSYKVTREVYGSISNLVINYLSGVEGSYRKIADKINKLTKDDFKISERQVIKIITSHPKYEPQKSSGQQQLFNFVSRTFKDTEVKDEISFTDTNKRMDVYIPEFKIGIEFNGDYWHSESVIQYNYNKSAYEFHKERVDQLRDLGIRLLYVWGNDWLYNYDEVEKAIREKDWGSNILNKYESDLKSNKTPPSARPGKIRYEIMDFLRKNDIHFNKNKNSSIIEIPEHNIVIDTPNYNSLSMDKYSLTLQKNYESKGIELLTFLPWRDIEKIKEFLGYRLNIESVIRISARKCDFHINDGIAQPQRAFFENNHLLGYGNFKNVEKTATLSYNNKIVMAALFTRKKGSETVELKRLVSAYGVSVQGGASKLLKNYIRNTKNVSNIYTFSDCDLGFGKVYNKLGFNMVERSREQLTWYNEEHDKVIKNLSLVMVGADRLLKSFPGYEQVGIGDNLPTNQEIVQYYSFVPIYDSGYKKWELKINQEV